MGRLCDVATKIEDAMKHGLLTLTHLRLLQCPLAVVAPQSPLLDSLWRLDLSFNLLTALPDAVGTLSALQVLYVNHNPRLATLPTTLAQCTKLQVVDASATALTALPCAFARLEHLKVLAIDATPLEKRWIAKKHLVRVLNVDNDSDSDATDSDHDDNMSETHDGASPPRTSSSNNKSDAIEDTLTTLTPCQQLLAKLRRKDERERLKRELFEKLCYDTYRLARSDRASTAAVHAMLQRVLQLFPVADELRSLVRNAERLFPAAAAPFDAPAMTHVDATALRRAYDVLHGENERTKRAADLELTIRRLYFDRIDPTRVDGLVRSIYAHVHSLQDITFLLQHAKKLFPPHATDVDGRMIQQQLVALQLEIARDRAAAIDKLAGAVQSVYSGTEPNAVQQLVATIAALFKSTKELRSLTADVSTLFPAEFLHANPRAIRSAFERSKAEVLGGSNDRSKRTNATHIATKK